jgi:hypothetical protein
MLLFVCNRGDTERIKHRQTMAYYCTHLCCWQKILQSITAVLRSRELDQAPILVFLTPRQALSSHPLSTDSIDYRLEIVSLISTLSTSYNPAPTQWTQMTHCCSLRALCATGCTYPSGKGLDYRYKQTYPAYQGYCICNNQFSSSN